MFARAFWFPALVLLAAAALLLTGCASPSLSPVYSDDRSNVVENNQIVGLWGAKDDDAKYEVLAGAEKSYVLKYTAKDKSSEFDLVLTTIGNQTIADVSPRKDYLDNTAGAYGVTMLPAHAILRLTIGKDRIEAYQLRTSRVEELAKADPQGVPTGRSQDLTVLTGTTEQVRAFVEKSMNDPDFWEKPIVLDRRTAAK